MTIEIIGPEAEAHLDWIALTEALKQGHLLPLSGIGDTFLYREDDTLLSRSAWIDGLGVAVKSATIVPENRRAGRPLVNGVVTLFDDVTGYPLALVDFHLVTKWKTAGDSLLAARLLARPDSRHILIVGAGAAADSMIEAYSAAFPEARFRVWARKRDAAEALALRYPGVQVVSDLEEATSTADIIATCTMSSEPVIEGRWIQPGTHLDLIGAYRPDMREVDDEAMRRASIFVNARATTVHHIGELMKPIATGVITEDDVIADFYDIDRGDFRRESAEEITLCKNGGGAHLDLMTGRYILDAWRARNG